MATAKKKIRITKKHIGRPCDFFGSRELANVVCHGRITKVNNGIARLDDCLLPGVGSGYTCCLPVGDDRIVEVY